MDNKTLYTAKFTHHDLKFHKAWWKLDKRFLKLVRTDKTDRPIPIYPPPKYVCRGYKTHNLWTGIKFGVHSTWYILKEHLKKKYNDLTMVVTILDVPSRQIHKLCRQPTIQGTTNIKLVQKRVLFSIGSYVQLWPRVTTMLDFQSIQKQNLLATN